jgi:hypothetical protein
MFTFVYVGWIVSIIGALPLVLGGAMNMMKASVMVKNMEHVGFSPDVLPVFGFIKIVIAAMSLVPATSFIGVILATGWMGGAVSAHIRVKDPYFVQVLIPIAIWVGFGLRHQDAMHSLLGF